MGEMRLLTPYIDTDGGPWAKHNYPCPVYRKLPAVIDVGTGIFSPSWEAQRDGWHLVQAKGWRLFVLRLLFQIPEQGDLEIMAQFTSSTSKEEGNG